MTSQTASPDSRPRVLVTGAAGFTGHHMVMQAARAGLRLRATDVSSRHYGALFDALDVEFVAADLTRREGLDRLLEGVDAVFHVAGIHDYSTPDEIIFAVNVKAVENLCDAAVAAGVGRFIHLSSVGVFGYGWRSGVPMRLLLPLAAISQRLAEWRKTQPALEVGTLHYLSCDRCWDSSKLLATGFELMHPSAVEGLRETLQWYRENGWFRS